MNALNRILVVVLILVTVVLVAVVVIVPRQSVTFGTTWLEGTGRYLDSYRTSHWALFAGLRVLIGGMVVLLGLVLLWLELRRPRRKTIRVQKTTGGDAHVAIESVAQRLAYNIDQLPDVVKVTPHITARSRAVDIELVLETAPDVDIPMKTEEVLQVTKEVIEDRMGLKLGKVQVKVKHAPYPKA